MTKSEEIVEKLVRITNDAVSYSDVVDKLNALKAAYENAVKSITGACFIPDDFKKDAVAHITVSEDYIRRFNKVVSDTALKITSEKEKMDNLYKDTDKYFNDMFDGKSWLELYESDPEKSRSAMSIGNLLGKIESGQKLISELENKIKK